MFIGIRPTTCTCSNPRARRPRPRRTSNSGPSSFLQPPPEIVPARIASRAPVPPVNKCCFPPPGAERRGAGGGICLYLYRRLNGRRFPPPSPPGRPRGRGLCAQEHSCAPALLRGSPTPLAGKRGACSESQTGTEAVRDSGVVRVAVLTPGGRSPVVWAGSATLCGYGGRLRHGVADLNLPPAL
jgi:hypothetical protein